MTEPFKLLPGDDGYDAVYRFWKQNDRPAICQMGSNRWMKLETDGIIVFIKLGSSDETDFHSISIGAGGR